MYLGDDAQPRAHLPADERLVDRLTASLSLKTAQRRKRLARIKRAVAASEYENPLKLSVALDRLIERIS